jgi:hypothetical protein
VTRRIRTTLLAATAATTLLLTAACGGSDNSDEEIEGVDEGGNEQQQDENENESESPEPTEDGIDRPEIVLPDDVENVFEGWESDDPEEQAVLDDAREQINATDLAVIEREPEADYVSFYTSGEALMNGQDWIQGFIDNGLTISGTVRYLEPDLTLRGDGVATLEFCADESEAQSVYVETGEALQDDTHPELFYSNTLREDERGVWVTNNVFNERGECSS